MITVKQLKEKLEELDDETFVYLTIPTIDDQDQSLQMNMFDLESYDVIKVSDLGQGKNELNIEFEDATDSGSLDAYAKLVQSTILILVSNVDKKLKINR